LIIPSESIRSQETNAQAFAPYKRQLWTGDQTAEQFAPNANLASKFPQIQTSRTPGVSALTVSPPPANPAIANLPPHPPAPVLGAKRAVVMGPPATQPPPVPTQAPTAETQELRATTPQPVAQPSLKLAQVPTSSSIPFPTFAQFTVVLHPAYRPPAPTPIVNKTGQIIYAPMDFSEL
jgi:hypothetical protein